MKEKHLYFEGRFAYSFGKNGQGLSDEFDIINQLVQLLSKDNHISIHKSCIDQVDDVYDLVFDSLPKEDVTYLLDDEKVES